MSCALKSSFSKNSISSQVLCSVYQLVSFHIEKFATSTETVVFSAFTSIRKFYMLYKFKMKLQ
ncbi:hypothetical protein RO3G_09381 [Rhizopus delemar RA 99-880]|uniref:Uncharacterized protein n=1 Tax=Rhizopus delemar (strain RA 99-880 / ATCC MYA-4621 / FGSC 9543 / NRRL 43880) TaxID=246409 RepID=I1C891_RHIO9|nr:hypothetical protein RO3G_09381 [Rhizopus delemar RA 99-880]|eukprot:EIE84671.1 hypothetical protein RO3G_09381 [Rhizopus delemar RA 99-880]